MTEFWNDFIGVWVILVVGQRCCCGIYTINCLFIWRQILICHGHLCIHCHSNHRWELIWYLRQKQQYYFSGLCMMSSMLTPFKYRISTQSLQFWVRSITSFIITQTYCALNALNILRPFVYSFVCLFADFWWLNSVLDIGIAISDDFLWISMNGKIHCEGKCATSKLVCSTLLSG